MTTSNDIYDRINELFEEFKSEHNKTTKVAKIRARKAIGELKKLITDYRKASVEEYK